MAGSPGYVLHRNPFMRGEGEEFQKERAKAVAVAEAELVAAIASGTFTDLDGGQSLMTRRIAAHHRCDQIEMNSNWVLTKQSWICPCCRRDKFAISRMAKARRIVCKLVVHHDHMKDALKDAFRDEYLEAKGHAPAQDGYDLVERMGKAWAAHDDVLLCEDCNNAEGKAKRVVRAPRHFTFATGQIARFIRASPHGAHSIDEESAGLVWNEARPAFELRVELIQRVARAAATNSHWYEPFPGAGPSEPVAWGVISLSCLAQLTPKLSVPKNLTRWRCEPMKAKPRLPGNILGLVLSNKYRADRWNATDAGWKCQCCLRGKHEIIGIANDGDASFEVKTASPANGWFENNQSICGDCSWIVQAMKTELTGRLGWRPDNSYKFATVGLVRSIVDPRPNQRHGVNADLAARVMDEITDRVEHDGPEAHGF